MAKETKNNLKTQTELEAFTGTWECLGIICPNKGNRIEWSYMRMTRDGNPVCGECGEDMELMISNQQESEG